jgi:large subunit ribosomal protein L22
MTLARAVARYIRMTPRKVDYVIRPLRRRTVADALKILQGSPRRAAGPVTKLLASAVANAKQRQAEVREEELVITQLVADEGPTWKRFRAAPFGRAVQILKRSTHITVELERKTHGA